MSAAEQDGTVQAFCLACKGKMRLPAGSTTQYLCPHCGAERINVANVSPFALLDDQWDDTLGVGPIVFERGTAEIQPQPTGGKWSVENSDLAYSILSDETNEAGDPKVIAVIGEDVASPLGDEENAANAFLLASAKFLRQSVEDLLEAAGSCHHIGGELPQCRLCQVYREARAGLAQSYGQEVAP